MKRGFTLIELLAVIVILAIIALIATPIVLSIIEETKESAVLRSAEYYLSTVELGVAKKNLTAGGSFSPNRCIVQNDGNLLCDDKDILEVELSGEVPSSGSITFNKGKIIDAFLTLSNKTIVKDENGKLVLGGEQEKTICKLIDDADNSNSITPGDKYQCKVKDDMETGFEDGYYFYVLSQESNGTTNLIMDRNIHYDEINDVGRVVTKNNEGNTEWYAPASNNSYGPVTAMNYLHNATKDWDKVSNIIMNYEDENIVSSTQQKGTTGYSSIVTTETTTIITNKSGEVTGTMENLKARMPKYSEVTGEGKCQTYYQYGENYGSCPLWLFNYMNSSELIVVEGIENISGVLGYWTLSSLGGTTTQAWYVDYTGNVINVEFDGGMPEDPWDEVYSHRNGVRPVINVKL